MLLYFQVNWKFNILLTRKRIENVFLKQSTSPFELLSACNHISRKMLCFRDCNQGSPYSTPLNEHDL
ncbi:hypothetical protein OIU79_002777 [Salix purpurea]|uniref:Uncharacterized protein n=1 Tax=Salix purpurea TaxID=77065 RepID=A0A9Q0UJZ5_SALPP|nr:hypothetical protein OIU79_002777 [Salix purpurea]